MHAVMNIFEESASVKNNIEVKTLFHIFSKVYYREFLTLKQRRSNVLFEIIQIQWDKK